VLRETLAEFSELNDAQWNELESHYELMMRWNQKLNLTSIRDLREIAFRHYGESLFLGLHLPPRSLRIADVGSGPGFPGFPVAVLRPDCSVTLIESHQRKAVFLKEVSRGMANVRVLARRAEDVDEKFDRVISRAVSYEDLAKVIKNLAPSADLLTGVEEPPPSIGLEWESAVPLPWGKQRFLRSGSVRFT
jgi:16S rRNA (guanine527-N7)-methyltransferase